MADKLHKRPSKGILKNSSSFDKQDAARSGPANKKSKETKWDEMNIIATLHPADKDYGHMKIDEPKTPYNYEDSDHDSVDVMDATELAEKIRLGTGQLPKALQSQSSEDDDEDEDLSPEACAKKKEFESKRKKHYNEFYAIKLARKLLEEEDEDEDDKEEKQSRASGSKPKHDRSSTSKMSDSVVNDSCSNISE